MIPEFPIRIGTIHPKININRSFKVDYLVKAKGVDKVILVELKTDDTSRRSKQDWYLERAKEVGMVKLIDGVLKIYEATTSKKKYRNLLCKAEDLGLAYRGGDGKFYVKRTNASYEIQIVYLQPNNFDRQENVISFADAAALIGQNGDELSLRFSESLLRWAEVRAGEQ